MPFAQDTLPEAVMQLPKEAQAIWLSVFNSTFRTFAGSETEKEEASFIAAWGAVRSKFIQGDDGEWSQKSMISFEDPTGMKGRWTRSIKFTPNLLEAKKRITYGAVYVPWVVDAQGDFADEGTIEDAAHAFIKHFGTIGEQHRFFGGKGVPVETFITRGGDSDFPTPGTWVLGTQWSEEMWQKVQNGEVTGYSLGGDWTRVPLVAGAEMAKRHNGKILVVAGKSADEALAELDEELFEQTMNAGPRIISQIIGLNVDEVSGVSLPANREPFKLFKSGGNMSRKVAVIGAAKCDCENPDDPKASPGGPWQKLYDSLVATGMSTDQARKITEEALGPAPPGTFEEIKSQELIQEVKGLKGLIKSIGSLLGVKEAEVTKEEDAMTPEEKIRLEAIESAISEIKALLAPKVEASEKTEAEKAKEATVAAPVTVPAETEAKGGDGEYQPTPGELELHNRVKELEGTIAALRARPGTSDVAQVVMAPEAVESGKSAGGYRYSDILGTHVPVSAQNAEIKANAERAKKLQERRNSYGHQGNRRVR